MGYDEWELKASPIKISELKPKNNLKHDTSSRVLHSPMAATVWFASPGVFALGVAPACPKRTGFRAPALPRRRVVRVQSKSGGKKDVSAGEGFGDADDWIANWKAGKFPRAKGWKFGDASEEGTGTFSEQVTGDGDEVDGRDEEISEETKKGGAVGEDAAAKIDFDKTCFGVDAVPKFDGKIVAGVDTTLKKNLAVFY